jgi:hypothetical protein
MSKRIIIVVEGETEEEFVKSSVAPYLQGFGIHDVRGVRPNTSPGHKGGIVSYGKFRNRVDLFLKQEKEIVVSSLIDFFRLPVSFPGYEESLKIVNPQDRVTFLENAMKDDLPDTRYIPYIQLHEFEALLFTDMRGFEYCGFETSQLMQVRAIMEGFPNPEDINNHPETAPSKRLMKIIPKYDKVLFGNIITQENGFLQILKKCPRFTAWMQSLKEDASGR